MSQGTLRVVVKLSASRDQVTRDPFGGRSGEGSEFAANRCIEFEPGDVVGQRRTMLWCCPGGPASIGATPLSSRTWLTGPLFRASVTWLAGSGAPAGHAAAGSLTTSLTASLPTRPR
jgi:hypothetical protein